MILSLFLTDFKNTIVVGVYSNRELQVLNKFFRKERKCDKNPIITNF